MAEARAIYLAAVPERDVLGTLLSGLRALGYLAWHVSDARREVKDKRTGKKRLVGDADIKDFPDVMAVHPIRGDWLALECKRQRTAATPGQKRALAAFGLAGARVGVVRPSNVNELLEALEREAKWHEHNV